MSEASTLGASVAGEPVAPESVAPEPVLPPSPRIPRPLEALAFVTNRRRTVEWLTHKYGRAVTVRIPVFGDSVLIADPVLAKQVFTTSPGVLHNIQPNLSRLLGPGSGVRPGRRRPSPPPEVADPAIPRQEHRRLRAHRRGGDAA